MASIGHAKLRCRHKGCNRVRPYWSDECKVHRTPAVPAQTANKTVDRSELTTRAQVEERKK